jgi:hypothetical protein
VIKARTCHPSEPISLEPIDTLSDTLQRGRPRFPADDFPIRTPKPEYRTTVSGHHRTYRGRTQEPRRSAPILGSSEATLAEPSSANVATAA